MNKILVIGDLMLDKFSYGNVKRLNPESPNPLLNIEKETYTLGGAGNVAANISSLQNNVHLIGVLGNDKNGELLSDLCKNYNIELYGILTNSPTITKHRFIENTYKQQLLRVDYEETIKLTKIQENKIIELINIIKPQITIISDYNKGIFTKSLVERILKNHNMLTLVDTKPLNYQLFKGVFLIKPNFREFCGMIGKNIENDNETIKKHGILFTKKMNCNLVITRGKLGATLITKEGKFYDIETKAKEVYDVTGAGDTFIAAIAYGLNNGYSLEKSIDLGNHASSIVIGKVGTQIINKNELEKALKE